MRAMLNLLCALAIFAWVSFSTACGPPPVGTDPDGGPICPAGSKSDCPAPPDGGTCPTGLQLVGGQCVKPDAGPPTDPCQGFVVPLATRCSSDGTPPFDFEIWKLGALPDNKCYLQGNKLWFVMTQEMSGATQFTATSTAGQTGTCIQ